MKTTREHQHRFGKITYIQTVDGPYNSVVVKKECESIRSIDDPTTWRPARIIVPEQHITTDGAILLHDAIDEAVREVLYLDNKYPVGSPVA